MDGLNEILTAVRDGELERAGNLHLVNAVVGHSPQFGVIQG